MPVVDTRYKAYVATVEDGSMARTQLSFMIEIAKELLAVETDEVKKEVEEARSQASPNDDGVEAWLEVADLEDQGHREHAETVQR